jgi:hypothetical protein
MRVKDIYESLEITRTTDLNEYGQCPKEATKEHYE